MLIFLILLEKLLCLVTEYGCRQVCLGFSETRTRGRPASSRATPPTHNDGGTSTSSPAICATLSSAATAHEVREERLEWSASLSSFALEAKRNFPRCASLSLALRPQPAEFVTAVRQVRAGLPPTGPRTGPRAQPARPSKDNRRESARCRPGSRDSPRAAARHSSAEPQPRAPLRPPTRARCRSVGAGFSRAPPCERAEPAAAPLSRRGPARPLRAHAGLMSRAPAAGGWGLGWVGGALGLSGSCFVCGEGLCKLSSCYGLRRVCKSIFVYVRLTCVYRLTRSRPVRSRLPPPDPASRPSPQS
jgi:hypothetical protein